jgi:hypothetical protein
MGTAPIGHGAALLPLDGLAPADRVVIRVWGSAAPLRFFWNPDVMATSHEIGFWTGVYFAVLAMVAFFIVVAVCVVRDPAMLWYLGFTLGLVGLELARDDMLPFDQAGNVALALAFVALSTFAALGFFVTYLNLRADAPRLLTLLAVSVVAPALVTVAVIFWTHAARPQRIQAGVVHRAGFPRNHRDFRGEDRARPRARTLAGARPLVVRGGFGLRRPRFRAGRGHSGALFRARAKHHRG